MGPEGFEPPTGSFEAHWPLQKRYRRYNSNTPDTVEPSIVRLSQLVCLSGFTVRKT